MNNYIYYKLLNVLVFFLFFIDMFVFIVIIVCEGDIEIIVYIFEVFENKFFVIIMKGFGKVVDLVFDFL